ncbi:MAG TPA: DNA polymerase IV [Acidimicrobiales bacterium]|nr:DNA polymerase IV [Acidimicrobiales bacterium]
MNSLSDDPTVDEAPILHVDLDAFFASVEILDDPTLKGKPVAVGGAGERGVIASASYEARRYGVRSAMPSVIAKRACPTLVILPGRFDRYEEYSRKFHDVVRDLTPDYEPLGLDEVFADLRSLRRLDVRPLQAAAALRRRITDELGLLCGVGLGRNKLFAKLASKESKPRVVGRALVDGPGVFWVNPAQEAEWLEALPVRALWGVGPATAEKLSQLGLAWVRDLARVDEATLALHVGPSMAAALAAYAKGEDFRDVVVDRELKSLGHDQTFARSLSGLGDVRQALKVHAGVVARALREKDRVARTITVIVRFDDRTSVSRSQTLPFGIDDEDAIEALGEALIQSVDLSRSVRLLGLHASGFLERSENQMQLSFGIETLSSDAKSSAVAISRGRQVDNEALRDAIDEVRRRFGRTSLATANELSEKGVDVATQRGRHAFGPDTASDATREP